VISKSDLIILVIASGALAIGIFRWHQNTQDVNAITIPASATSKVVVEPVQHTELALVSTAEVNDSSTNNAIAQANNATQPATKTVVVPEPVVEIVVASNDNDPLSLGTHRVISGDYLGKIASQYGTDVQTLRDLNKISGSVIQIGQEILYPL